MKVRFPAALTLLLALPLGAAEDVVGWVDAITGEAEQLRLERAGEIIQIAPLLAIHKGDKIWLLSDESSARLMLDGEPVLVSRKDSPYTVAAAEKPASVVSNLVDWVSKKVGIEDGSSYAALVGAVSRGGDLSLSHFGTVARVGQRDQLYLGWTGGEPPFTVRLLGGGATQATASTEGFDATLDTPGLAPGRYGVELRDARGVKQLKGLEVVAAGRVPPAPAELDTYGHEARTLLYAAYLAQSFSGEWNLEAAQWLASSRPDERAELLLAAIR